MTPEQVRNIVRAFESLGDSSLASLQRDQLERRRKRAAELLDLLLPPFRNDDEANDCLYFMDPKSCPEVTRAALAAAWHFLKKGR